MLRQDNQKRGNIQSEGSGAAVRGCDTSMPASMTVTGISQLSQAKNGMANLKPGHYSTGKLESDEPAELLLRRFGIVVTGIAEA